MRADGWEGHAGPLDAIEACAAHAHVRSGRRTRPACISGAACSTASTLGSLLRGGLGAIPPLLLLQALLAETNDALTEGALGATPASPPGGGNGWTLSTSSARSARAPSLPAPLGVRPLTSIIGGAAPEEPRGLAATAVPIVLPDGTRFPQPATPIGAPLTAGGR